MAEYRVICLDRLSGGDIDGLGYSESGNEVMYDDRWTLEQARRAIEAGHRLFMVNPSTGDELNLELDGESIRARGGEGGENYLDKLPACG